MFKNSALFGTSFPLVKIAPKVRGYVIDCSEFCVLFRGTRSIRIFMLLLNNNLKEFTMGNKTSKDKNGGTFTTVGEGKDKTTVYESKTGKTATFKGGKKLDKKG
jgi:hypothetical protein